MLNYNLDNSVDFSHPVPTKKTKGESEVSKEPKRTTIKIPKLYEFQFFDNFEELQDLATKIQNAQAVYKPVSEEDKERFRELASTGFLDWSKTEYQAFIKGVRKCNLGDVASIAKEVETKTLDEVEEYLRVFMVRYKELKEKDIVLSKLHKQDFEQRNLQTIRDFDEAKQSTYALLLQENHFFSRTSYLALLQKAHSGMLAPDQPLQLKLDHFFHSQTQKIFEDQLKYACLAVRAEDCLREHLAFQSERKHMRAVIQRSQAFNKGFKETIASKDTELQGQDEEAK